MTKLDFSKYVVEKPAYEVTSPVEIKGRIPPMTLMSSDLVPAAKMYVETGWVLGMPDPNPHIGEHTHDYDEIILHLGMDPSVPEDLGGEIEICVGGQPFLIKSTSAIYVPKGVKHGPLTWKKVDRPHLELTIMIGAGTLAKADPGGHEAVKKQSSVAGRKSPARARHGHR
jgi:hypothetical protein